METEEGAGIAARKPTDQEAKKAEMNERAARNKELLSRAKRAHSAARLRAGLEENKADT